MWKRTLHVLPEYKTERSTGQLLKLPFPLVLQVILVTHHPLGDGIIEWDDYISELSLQYKDVIVLQLVGHKHKDTWRLVSSTRTRTFPRLANCSVLRPRAPVVRGAENQFPLGGGSIFGVK